MRDTSQVVDNKPAHSGFPDDDIVVVLREMVQYTNHVAGGVCWRAADEIERLRGIISEYFNAEQEYSQSYEADDVVILKQQWKNAWNELEKEAIRNDSSVR
jgi:hypothetical protein